MGTRYQHIVYGDAPLRPEYDSGPLRGYGAGLDSPDQGSQEVGEREIRMLTTAFAFHLATVTPAGWPYVQYRSGPPGFVHHLGGNRFAFADFRGNQQFVSVGNMHHDDRVALFVANYPLRRRMKAFGRAITVEAADDPDLLEKLRVIDGGQISAQCERSVVIEIEAFDWNCGRSIVPQYTSEQVRERVEPYIAQIHSLQDEVAELRRQVAERD
ncbi:pyridoxamine 5'-phosphate oxidase family protein [Gordonia hydrophobica]|uniref:Pyridoxamine 5'-phosphate oxidase family protein n=1 Tax=Gordonia hydrophobica TaxID=40516 RepID=A0ABZ2TY55_9ACTN|nr:pyridoxamine 5'-phosphate oxidase family protein [Gordonia hydrophobica]MBM7366528.1 putative pyridoxine 5'-phosphate oxidase superfamily flavin-nucleotide-binding protein [Gordonia hydrophobica]